MSATKKHLSSEALDLLELGALPPDEREELEVHLAGCAACAERRSELQTDAAHFRQFVHPRTADRVIAPRAPFRRWALVAAGVGALAAGFAAVLLLTTETTPRGVYLATRGEAAFRVVVARGDVQTELRPGQVLTEGDRLRFIVDPGEAKYVMIISRDGAGAWSVYAPFGGETSEALQGETTLPGAVSLDATSGQEQLFAVFSDRPLRARAVIAGLQDAPSSDVPGASDVLVVAFDKR